MVINKISRESIDRCSETKTEKVRYDLLCRYIYIEMTE